MHFAEHVEAVALADKSEVDIEQISRKVHHTRVGGAIGNLALEHVVIERSDNRIGTSAVHHVQNDCRHTAILTDLRN